MRIHFSLVAAISLEAAKRSLGKHVEGLTPQDQINKCRELEAEAHAFASDENREKREGHLRMADGWASLATEMESAYYLLHRAPSSHRR